MIGFDNEKYIQLQSKKIKERLTLFDQKLYLEFGGKLYDDFHAARVLPGFDPNVKIHLLEELKEQAEVILCINANDIENNKIRADYGIPYDMEVLRLIERLRLLEIEINSVVITLYQGQASIPKFERQLKEHQITSYRHYPTKGYPTDVDVIVSEEGYGANPYISTTKPLVVVTAPGPGSGKLATCLSQLYHEYQRGNKVGYAKFETFPVWDLPLKHPINMAYEAATADLNDRNMIDAFHLETYGVQAVNYNRDLETFPILKTILRKIMKEDVYASPTDMGVNMVGSCLKNEEVVIEACKQEIIRRYYKAQVDYKLGHLKEDVPKRIKILMNELGLAKADRKVIAAALEKQAKSHFPALALELPNGQIITGRQTELLTPPASMLLNAIKVLTQIPDAIQLLSPSLLEPIAALKSSSFNKESNLLNLQEVLIALSICAVTNPVVATALQNLEKLKDTEAHATYIVQNGDYKTLRNLGIRLTCEDEFYPMNSFS